MKTKMHKKNEKTLFTKRERERQARKHTLDYIEKTDDYQRIGSW